MHKIDNRVLLLLPKACASHARVTAASFEPNWAGFKAEDGVVLARIDEAMVSDCKDLVVWLSPREPLLIHYRSSFVLVGRIQDGPIVQRQNVARTAGKTCW